MKKKWFGVVSVLMTLAVLFTGLPAMAQAETEEVTEIAPVCPALGIRAPQVAYVGQKVTITVFERGSSEPVEGAFVFALSWDNAEAFKAEMATLRQDSFSGAEDVDYQSLAEAYGELIGVTGNNGDVYHAFNEAGWYLLLAVKVGYYPGFTPITVRPTVRALGINAPQNARVGEEVTINVYERATQQPVEGALVFAISPVAVEAFQAELNVLREDATIDVASLDYEELARRHGDLIGITNEYGEVYHAFEQAGRYLLIAVKPDYIPGFTRINIWPAVKALGIKAPDTAQVGEEVTITVFERGTGEVVEGAFVFALSRENAEVFKAEIAILEENITAATTDIDYESLARAYGELLDITDENGEVHHAFDKAGWYLLVAVKRGYYPGFAHITVGPVVKALRLEAPDTAQVGEEVKITVFERATGETVEGAFVFALSRDNATALNEEITRIRETEGINAIDIDYKALADIYGELIGITNQYGEVYHAFDEAGWYLLLAVKPDYLPGFRLIHIGTMPKALVIDAPETAPVGEMVTIGVSERATGEAVEGAFVFTLSRDNATALNEEITRIRETEGIDAIDIDYKALADIYGELIGITNQYGEVYHAFDEAGWYLLLAVKPDYLPGFAPIRIGEFPRMLGIRAPRMAKTGDEVTIGVFERGTQSPVEGAGVWLVSRENIGLLQEEIAKLKEEVSAAEDDVDYEPLIGIYGQFIDWTDENGEVRHTFNEPGLYLLVAVKRGYYPGFALIRIRSLSVDSSGNVMQANSLIPVRVLQANSPKPVQLLQANSLSSTHVLQVNSPKLLTVEQASVSWSPKIVRWIKALKNVIQLKNKLAIIETN